jgi:hypothetical protein
MTGTANGGAHQGDQLYVKDALAIGRMCHYRISSIKRWVPASHERIFISRTRDGELLVTSRQDGSDHGCSFLERRAPVSPKMTDDKCPGYTMSLCTCRDVKFDDPVKRTLRQLHSDIV